MKHITTIAFVALASILSAGKVLAQSHEVRSAVPFDFTVGDKLLPAGTYSILPISEGIIVIRNRETHVAVLAPAFADSNRSTNGGKLVFNKYASQYFLKEILCESAAMNVNLPSTKAEKRARSWAEEQAKLHNGGDQVMVAAR
jgi:hypothetical protein